jgi:hypothetical protein
MLVLLSFLSLAFCLVAGGFLTADCVSSERREGTLGLLFLTPLTGMDIVLGKMVCHGLQMFYGMCAVFPVFFLPLLAGGVTWAEVSRIVLALGLALLLAASIGMLVSVLGTESRKTILATFASIVLIASVPMLYLMSRSLFFPGLPSVLAELSPVFTVITGFDSSYRGSAGPKLFWGSILAVAGVSLILIMTCGFLIGRVFQTMGASPSRLQIRPALSVLAVMRDGNPYEWAVLRNSTEARSLGFLTHFSIALFAGMLLVSLTTKYWREGFIGAFFAALALHLIHKLHLAVEATRQINADQQSGAFELLLVTPLSEESISKGHRDALRSMSRKPLLLLIGLNLILEFCVVFLPEVFHMRPDDQMMFTTLFIGGIVLAAADFSALRCQALLKGLRRSSHVRAAMLTFSSVMVVPWIVGLSIASAVNTGPRSPSLAITFLIWIISCLVYDWMVICRCRARLKGGLRRLASEGF